MSQINHLKIFVSWKISIKNNICFKNLFLESLNSYLYRIIIICPCNYLIYIDLAIGINFMGIILLILFIYGLFRILLIHDKLNI